MIIKIKERAKKPKKKKPKSIARLVDDCAVLLQKLVRLKASRDDFGLIRCVTCGVYRKWNEMQGGHFIERGKRSTKLVEENCHPQCPGCNMYRMKTTSGVLAYRRYMVGMYGEELVKELERLSKQPKKYTRSEIEELSAEFKRQIKIQEERLGI